MDILVKETNWHMLYEKQGEETEISETKLRAILQQRLEILRGKEMTVVGIEEEREREGKGSELWNWRNK